MGIGKATLGMTATGARRIPEMANGECHPQQKPSAISEATNRIGQELEALNVTLENLANRLAPIMTPQGACGQTTANDPRAGSGLTCLLQGQADKVFELRTKVQQVIDALEL